MQNMALTSISSSSRHAEKNTGSLLATSILEQPSLFGHSGQTGTLTPAKPTYKLLIVDDSLFLHEILEAAFGELYGYYNTRILRAYQGKMGLRVLLDEQPDVVLFDLRMPLMNGLDMIASLQESEVWQAGYRPHLIALTGQLDIEDIERAMNLGVQDYYTKPFNVIALLDRLRSLFQK